MPTKTYRVTAVNAEGRTYEVDVDLSLPWSGWAPPNTVIANPEQPRDFFDEVELALLGESLRTGQANPSTAIPYPTDSAVRWMIGDGERRLRAIRKEGLDRIWLTYSPGVTQENLHEVSFKANCCRQGHTHAETARAIDRELRTGKKYHQIGAMVGKGEQWARGEHLLLKLRPELLKLVDPPTPKQNRIPGTVARALAAFDPDKQLAEWENIKASGVTRANMFKTLHARGTRGVGRGLRRPSHDISIIKNRVRRCRDDVRFFNNEWKDRIAQMFPGVDVSLIVDSLDEAVAEATLLKATLLAVSAQPKASPPAPGLSGRPA